jgi:hypothetical protein
MGWIKRNLLFVISGLVAVVLLGVAGFFIYQSWTRNSEASDKLNEVYNTLQTLAQSPLQPGNDRIDNIKLAKDQEQQLREWITNAAASFHPISPIPQGQVTSKTYATALGSTIYELQQEAKNSSVGLPSQYYFSFQVQSTKLTISSGLEPLAQQLGEVKAIAEILFAARVNALDAIQRPRVSDDDVAGGLQSDYIEERPITNSLAIMTPYVVTFQSFTPELAKVLAGFAASTNSFIVKSVSVVPAAPGGTGEAAEGEAPGMPERSPFGPGMARPPWMQGREQPAPAAPAAGKGGLQTVLKEQLLRITLEVEVVKLLPKS